MTPPEIVNKFKRFKQELSYYKKQEEVYKNMLDRLQIGVITVHNGQIKAANKKIINLLGYQQIDFIGQAFKSICPLRQANNVKSEDVVIGIENKALPSPYEILDWQFLSKENKAIQCEIVASLLQIENDTLVQLEIQEVSPKKTVARKLKEKAKEIETLSEERESLNEELRATLDELVEVNKQLSESESWNKSIVENIPLGLVVIQNGEVEYINDSLLKILACRNAEIEWKSILDDSLNSEFVKIIQEYKNENGLSEFWIVSTSNEAKYIRNQYVKLNNKSRWMVITTDLTNEKRRENEIRTAHERLEFALEANQSVIWDVDFNSPTDIYNKNFGRLFGYSDEELQLTGSTWQEFVHPDDFQMVKHELQRHYNGEVPYYDAECRIRTKDGNYKWVLSRGKVFNLSDNGLPNRFIGMFIDIAIRKAAEEALEDTENRLSMIVRNAPLVFFSLDPTGIITLFEGKNFEKLGFDAHEILGKNITELYEKFPNVIQAIRRALDGETIDELFITDDLVFDTHLAPIFDEKGKLKAVVGIANDISEKKKAEENLKFSEEKFRTIVQHLSDIILIVNAQMVILYESPSVSTAFGYNSGLLVGENMLKYVHPDDLNMAKYDFGDVMKGTNDFKPTEIRVKHKNGNWIYVEVLGNNLSDHPAINGILITARNITERKENEVQLGLYRDHLEHLVKKRTEEIEQMNAELIAINEEIKATNEELVDKNEKLNEEIIKRIQAQLLLEESENKFRSFLEQSTEGIALIDEQGLIVDWNKGMESIFRISRADVINTYVWEFDYRFLPEKRKNAEQFEQLRNSILEYFSNLNQSKVMTVEGIYQTMELKQKYLNVTIFPVVTPNRKYVGRLIRDVTGIRRAQEEIRKQSEELQLINENLEEQKSQVENTLQELQKTQAQLIQSEKMASLGLLTAGVAHEINNPINYINTALEGLKITLADFLEIFYKYEEIKPENTETKLFEIEKLKLQLDFPLLQEGITILLNNMQTGIGRITEIVRSLRTFARVEENELKFSNVHELLDTTLVMLHNQYKNRIDIVKKYGSIPAINCYPGKLSQVFMNILSNAIQSIPDRGQIEIITHSEFSKLHISIIDSGSGIPEHLREKIFEPFYTTKEAGRGTGLGLSITYGIVQQHQGSIEARARSDQKQGTEFYISIPTTLKQL